MDAKTLNYYRNNAKELFESYHSCQDGVSKYFSVAFPKGAKILDIGAGSGRDVSKLLKMGYDATGVEPCPEFVDHAIAKFPELKSKLSEGQLPDLSKSVKELFEGILCSAVLMHIPDEQLFDTVFDLRNHLKDNGRLLLSLPLARPGIRENRDDDGRLFFLRSPDYVQLLFERVGFQLIGKWTNDDGLGREGYSWVTLLFHLRNSQLIRPIDQVEGILNRDRKTATYKIALFRSLCEIATVNFHLVKWLGDGRVGVPISAVVERWISYYWSLFESKQFIPQNRGETERSRKPVAFRSSLTRLIRFYSKAGGLQGFTLDYRSSYLREEAIVLLREVFKSIRRTIVEGPVTYAGGSLETGKVFSYDARKGLILLNTDLWQELSLMGHWINDAIILRWAEQTSNFSRNSLKSSDVIELLLTVPLPERDVCHVRNVYKKLAEKECVWSGKRLIQDQFDVDHVIPYALWRNNDLWNLLPVNSGVNRNKSDRLPTRHLLSKRKECILHYWQIMKEDNPSRFKFEVTKFSGIETLDATEDWQFPVFNTLLEAVEVTAIQRGCERWEV